MRLTLAISARKLGFWSTHKAPLIAAGPIPPGAAVVCFNAARHLPTPPWGFCEVPGPTLVMLQAIFLRCCADPSALLAAPQLHLGRISDSSVPG
jgi:EamA domain-containing membrane protein RarD